MIIIWLGYEFQFYNSNDKAIENFETIYNGQESGKEGERKCVCEREREVGAQKCASAQEEA